jgi:predicted O-methyltransferase YrrM
MNPIAATRPADRSAVRRAIDELELLDKQGPSYATTGGRHGWRNPIRGDTGPLLEALVLAHGGRRVLEIGTAHGLSALHLVCGIQDWENGSLETIELDAEVAAAAQRLMDALEVPVRVLPGDAAQVIESLEGTFDVVFLDAQKSHYLPQLELLLDRDLIGPGTLVLGDNVIDRSEECAPFLAWFAEHGVPHRVVPTECGLLVARL